MSKVFVQQGVVAGLVLWVLINTHNHNNQVSREVMTHLRKQVPSRLFLLCRTWTRWPCSCWALRRPNTWCRTMTVWSHEKGLFRFDQCEAKGMSQIPSRWKNPAVCYGNTLTWLAEVEYVECCGFHILNIMLNQWIWLKIIIAHIWSFYNKIICFLAICFLMILLVTTCKYHIFRKIKCKFI